MLEHILIHYSETEEAAILKCLLRSWTQWSASANLTKEINYFNSDEALNRNLRRKSCKAHPIMVPVISLFRNLLR